MAEDNIKLAEQDDEKMAEWSGLKQRFVPTTCVLCPPDYGWCDRHERCKRHCDCRQPGEAPEVLAPQVLNPSYTRRPDSEATRRRQ
jgi:hypothetical protein